MKVSLSIPAEDLEFLDAYAASHDAASRSAAVQHAIRALRALEMADDYEGAFAEWSDSGDQAAWDGTVADGLNS